MTVTHRVEDASFDFLFFLLLASYASRFVYIRHVLPTSLLLFTVIQYSRTSAARFESVTSQNILECALQCSAANY